MPVTDPDALTDRELKAIASLERLAKTWPQTLAFFGASGTLSIRKGGHGSQCEVAYISQITCDGGDGGDEF